ncbi:dTDP-4-dehydrorhamnose 3,5-epimerase [Flavobacteriaceae bacterium R38]|nr:dTDP-4-dehydrorhamnose 3,5-epimerase [Flavobacteriaceae bacterium R38]
MIVEETNLSGCYLIKPRIFEDDRGFFMETFNDVAFEEKLGFKPIFVQDNQSTSGKGVLRGLHFQTGNHAQAKLVRVISGKVLDVVVDLRKNSKTYGNHYKTVLSEENNYQLYIPKDFAHGFLTLSEKAVFSYKCDAYYNKQSEGGIIYNDPDLDIDWGTLETEIILSDKDKALPLFKELVK